MPDLVRELPGRPRWRSSLYVVGALLCFVLGIIGWLMPVVTGLPFYALGLVLLGLAGARPRRWVNALERRMPEHLRLLLRQSLARWAGPRLRRVIHVPGDPPPEATSMAGLRLAAGPAAFVVLVALPMPSLSPEAHRLAAVFAWVVVYWVTQALPLAITALLSSVLAITLGVAPARDVLAPYADPVIFLFVGSFILAEAMKTTGLDRRFAVALLSRRWATRSPGHLLAAVGIITCTVSLWISNTATTAMMLPLGLGLLRALGPLGDVATSRYPVGLLLMLTWASSVAVGIPVGSPPNLIAIGLVRELTGRSLTFFDWTVVTMPATVAMLAICWLILRRLYREPADLAAGASAFVAAERLRLGPWTTAQRCVAGVFAAAAALWMLPGAVAAATSPVGPVARWLEGRLPESAVALGASVMLFVLPTGLSRGDQAVAWKRMAAIDWSTILLFGGGLSLGRLMFETRLAEAVGAAMARGFGADSLWSLTAVAIVTGVLLSETCSNTASASMVVPVMIAIAQATGVSPVPPALGAALGASLGFMLPVSTPPNAIIYGSGLVPLREMIRAGAVLDVLGALVIWLTLRLLCPLLGVI
jgi:sodium-dependent dicarboxylate transporter 2/3/5